MVFFDLVLCQIEKGIRVGFLPRVSNGTASGRSWLVGRFFVAILAQGSHWILRPRNPLKR